MRLISDAEVAATLNMRDAIAATTAAFEQYGNGAGAIAPRVRAAATHNAHTAAIAAMGAALPAAGVVGAKVYSTIDGRFDFAIVLFSALTGAPLATSASTSRSVPDWGWTTCVGGTGVAEVGKMPTALTSA